MTDIDELRARHLVPFSPGLSLREEWPIAEPASFTVGTLRALLDELAELRDAIKPFAAAGKDHFPNTPDSYFEYDDKTDDAFSAGSLRRAWCAFNGVKFAPVQGCEWSGNEWWIENLTPECRAVYLEMIAAQSTVQEQINDNCQSELRDENERLQAELAALRSAQQWQPLSQDYAENILFDCLKAMKVPGDDKCLIDEMRARGVWVYQKPAPATASQPRDSSNED